MTTVGPRNPPTPWDQAVANLFLVFSVELMAEVRVNPGLQEYLNQTTRKILKAERFPIEKHGPIKAEHV